MDNMPLVTIKVEAKGLKQGEMKQDAPSPMSMEQTDRLQPEKVPSPLPQAPEIRHPEPTLGVKFMSAGLAACFADVVTFPLDTAKVRLQIQGEGSVAAAVGQLKYRGVLGTIMTISREEGGRALYNGLVPGLQRQMAFASIRIGLYDSVKGFYLDLFNAGDTVGANNVGLRILAGITTGAAAVGCAQPTDVVKVRMQAAGKGPKRYTGCMNAYRTIAAQEGMRGLWKGILPNIARNSIVNAAEMVSYDLIKESILKYRLMSDNMPCHFVSAFGAGFCTTVAASPVDVVKTRYMNSPEGKYKGAIDCALGMYREKGLFTFYKGFMPSFMRLGSWNIVMFMTYEQLKRAITKFNTTTDSSSTPLSEVSLKSNVSKSAL